MVAAFGPRVTDHALLRFLERSGMDVEAVRASITSALGRAHELAETMGGGDHLITIDKMSFVVRNGAVTTVLVDPGLRDRFNALVPSRT